MVRKVVIGVLVLSATFGWAQEVRVPDRLTAEYLATIDPRYFVEFESAANPEFNAIVGQGLAIVPELLDLLGDPTETEHNVPLFGGHYAVGDVAMSAISDIVRVPWLEFVTTPDDPRIEQVGFGVYWAYVRESNENRGELARKAKDWYQANASDFVWRPIPNLAAGGVYELPEPKEERETTPPN